MKYEILVLLFLSTNSVKYEEVFLKLYKYYHPTSNTDMHLQTFTHLQLYKEISLKINWIIDQYMDCLEEAV